MLLVTWIKPGTPKKREKKPLHHLGMKKPPSFNPRGSSAHVVLEDWVEQELVATGDTVY